MRRLRQQCRRCRAIDLGNPFVHCFRAGFDTPQAVFVHVRDAAGDPFDMLLDRADPGLSVRATFSVDSAPAIVGETRPRVAILREQGVAS